jgi:flavin-dependent dehydrogenase
MINMPKIWDVIIIGSGPAGSISGIILARNQLNVLLIEKYKLPRNKICSGMVSKGAQRVLKKLGLEFPEAICTRPRIGKGVKVQFLIENEFFEIPEKFYNVWRRDFDYWLTIEANKAGVKVEDETKLIDLHKNNDYITIKVRYKDQVSGERKLKEYKTKYIIAADGGRSTTRKLIYPNFERDTGIAYQEYWEGEIDLDPRYFHGFMDRELSAGYAFCNMKEDQIIIGVGAEKGKNIKKYQKKFIEYLKKGWSLKLTKFIRREACIATNIFTPQPKFQHLYGKDNILLVGEAADLFNIMGEGIPSAIISARNAANSIIEHINNQELNVADIYENKNKHLVEKLEKNWEGYWKQYETFTNL